MNAGLLRRGDRVMLQGEEVPFVVFSVGEGEIGVFPFYPVEDVDDKKWNESEMDWEVVGQTPLPLSEWYNPAARFDNDEAVVKYGVAFRQFVSVEKVVEVTQRLGDWTPQIGDWVLVDDNDRGILSGVIDALDGKTLKVHLTHHKCATASCHWDESISIDDVVLSDTTYQDSYAKCLCLDSQ